MAERWVIEPKPTDRDRAIHDEYFPLGEDSDVPVRYELEDLIFQLRHIESGLVKEERYAEALHVPAAYVRALRAKFKLVKLPDDSLALRGPRPPVRGEDRRSPAGPS
jgi:hypothetical protein